MPVAVVSALAYLVLLAVSLRRAAGRHDSVWTNLFLLLSLALAAGLGFQVAGGFSQLHPAVSPGRVFVGLHLLGIGLFGAMTTAYLNRGRPVAWAVAGLVSAALTIGLDLLAPGSGLGQASWLAAVGAQPPAVAAVAGAGLYLVFLTLILMACVQALRGARLPLHANRALFWLIAVPPLVLVGDVSIAWGSPAVQMLGQAIRLAGAAGVVYAATGGRLMDVRHVARSGLGAAVVVLFTAAVILLGSGLVQLATGALAGETRLLAVLGVALGLAALYQLMRGRIEDVVGRAVLVKSYDPAQVARDYSRQATSLLDVDELARASAEMLRSAVDARWAALLLVTQRGDGFDIRAVPGFGYVPTEPARFSADNPVLAALAARRQPIFQYDLDLQPAFRHAPEAEAAWLRSLGMDVYVPMMDGPVLCGVLAAGPRACGDPYRDRELDVLGLIAEQTAIALKNARLFTDLRALNRQMQELNESLQTTNEKLASIDAAKSDFISIASHELRTPLTQLRGYTDVLSAMSSAGMLQPDTIEQVAASLVRACDRLEHVIAQMLDVSQIDVDVMAFHFAEARLPQMLHAAAQPLAGALRDRRLSLIYDGVDDVPPIVCDHQRLIQMFAAVIGNAIKYTPDGGRIEVLASCESLEGRPPEAVEIVVADSGVGIDPKYHDLIFDKFFRVGSAALHSTGATKFMGAGPGLGLPLARGVVQGHGGRIWVESSGFSMEKMPGSRFHIWLPLKPPDLRGTEPIRLPAAALSHALLEEERRAEPAALAAPSSR
jgi:signal transduction histidine kinase